MLRKESIEVNLDERNERIRTLIRKNDELKQRLLKYETREMIVRDYATENFAELYKCASEGKPRKATEHFTIREWLFLRKFHMDNIMRQNMCAFASVLYQFIRGHLPPQTNHKIYLEADEYMTVDGAYMYSDADEFILVGAKKIVDQRHEPLPDYIKNSPVLSVSEIMDNLGYEEFAKSGGVHAKYVVDALKEAMEDDMIAGIDNRHYFGGYEFFYTEAVRECANQACIKLTKIASLNFKSKRKK
jgi:hypothetical protein